jgi:hypothetical protein
VSFAAITLCVASQLVLIVVDFVINSVRKLLDTPSYCLTLWPVVTAGGGEEEEEIYPAALVRSRQRIESYPIHCLLVCNYTHVWVP